MKPLELLVARICERKHRPVDIALARAHVHPADDAVRSRRGGDQDAFAIGAMPLDCIREIDRRSVHSHADGLDGACRRRAKAIIVSMARNEARRKSSGAFQAPPLSILPRRSAGATIRGRPDPSELCAYLRGRRQRTGNCGSRQ